MDKFIKILRIVLGLFIFTWVVIWYSARAQRKKESSRNLIMSTVLSLAEAPGKVKAYFQNADDHLEKFIEPSDNLYEIGKLPDNSYLDESHYLLRYQYLGENTGKVLLQNIKNGDVAISWDIPLSLIMKDVESIEKELKNRHNAGLFALNYKFIHDYIPKDKSVLRVSSPIMTSDSSLIFNF